MTFTGAISIRVRHRESFLPLARGDAAGRGVPAEHTRRWDPSLAVPLGKGNPDWLWYERFERLTVRQLNLELRFTKVSGGQTEGPSYLEA